MQVVSIISDVDSLNHFSARGGRRLETVLLF